MKLKTAWGQIQWGCSYRNFDLIFNYSWISADKHKHCNDSCWLDVWGDSDSDISLNFTAKKVMLFYSELWVMGNPVLQNWYPVVLWKLIDLKVHGFWSASLWRISYERKHSMLGRQHDVISCIQTPGLQNRSSKHVLEQAWESITSSHESLLWFLFHLEEPAKQQD